MLEGARRTTWNHPNIQNQPPSPIITTCCHISYASKAFGITANNLYAIRFRIERLLASKGRELFRQKQRQEFLVVA